MPHFGRTRSAMNVSTLDLDACTTVVPPEVMVYAAAPVVLSPIVISTVAVIHLFCSGASGVRANTDCPNRFSSIIGVLPTRRSDVVMIGELPFPGILNCMMCVKLVVASKDDGMYMS